MARAWTRFTRAGEMNLFPPPVLAEPVEALPFLSSRGRRQPFDKLREGGVGVNP